MDDAVDASHRSSGGGGGVVDEQRALAGQLVYTPTTAAVAARPRFVPISREPAL